MAKQLNIDLSFNADTGKARAQIMDLQKSLDQLISSTIKNNNQLGIDKEIKQAIDDATKLKVALQAATDADTGKLNLAKFSESLKNGQMSLSQYAQHLKALGSEGEQSFLKLSKAIVSAETPMRQTNTLLNQMFVTLKNTAKWQISSSIIHGLQSGLSQAFSYAKELDTSLNNIRIVTGYGVDEMAKFAEQANKAAQSLSTTTTKYTDAALIYYQQGLSDEEVLGRTETTIKLANVSRQSTEEVSDQLTAIWNNFYDGSQSLEYYADVITALGAATASSSEEISSGLQKFAAVSQTVGLSYEYATAALATITATTRESADTVGNGLRTLFTRLEGLKLGKTLEDGVDLNKYSAALSAVGVQILDTSGELRNMDDILEDLGARWQQLGRDQKMALAQTVGGVRQYNNLIALMDNWDFMQENLATARGSEGALQEQANIYAESWEAAQKRVRAAAQQIYKDLIDEKFFIKLGDFFTTALNGVDNFINAIGGIPGVIAGVGVILTTVFGKQLSESINSAMYEFSRFTGKAEDIANTQRQDALKAVNDYYNVTGASGGSNDSVASALLRQEINDSYELQKNIANLTDEQKAYSQAVLETAERYNELAINAEKANSSAATDLSSARSKLRGNLGASKAEKGDSALDIRNKGETTLKEIEKRINDQFNQITNGAYKNYTDALTEADDATKDYIVAKNELLDEMNKENSSTQAIEQAQQKLDSAYNKVEQTTKKLHDAENTLKQTRESLSGSSNEIIASLEKEGLITNQNKSFVLSYISALEKSNLTREDTIRKIKIAIDQQREIPEKLKKIQVGFQDIGTGAVTTLKGVSQLAMGITSIKGAMDALNNTELTFFEKFSRVSMGLSIGISQFASGLPVLSKGVTALGGGLAKVVPGLSGTGAAATIAAGGLSGVALAAGIVTVAIGVVTGVVLGLKAAWEHFTPEGKMAVAKKEAEEAKKSFEESKNAVTDFKTTYDDWSSLYEKTQTLKKYTDEYKESILKADEAALELIKKYDLIKGQDWTIDKDGHITINPESKKNALDKDYYNNLINDNKAEIATRQSEIDVAAKIASKAESDQKGYLTDLTGRYIDQYKELANFYLKNGTQGLQEKYLELGLGAQGKVGGGYQELLPKIIDLAEQMQGSQSVIDLLTRQNEVTEAKLSLGNNYKAELEPLLNQFVGKNIGVNGEGTGSGVKTAQDIADAYNNALSSIKSSDIDDSTKQSLALALAEAQLKGSQIVDLSGVDVSGLKKAIGDKYEEVFGENADIIQAAIDRSSDQIDLKSFTTKFAEIHKIIDKLSDGSIIEPDDYNMLMAANEGTSEFFVKMLDGTYKLIGDAEEFYNLIHGQQIDDAKKQISELQERNKGIDKVKERLIDEESGETRYLDSQDGQDLLFSNAWDQNYTDKEGNSTNSVVKDQMGLLSDLGYDQTQLDSWKEGGYTQEEMQEIADAISQYKEQLLSLNDAKAQNIQTEQELANGILMSSTSFNDLTNNMQSLLATSSEGVNLAIGYDNALISLGSQLDNCKDEVEEFKDALSSNNEEAIKTARVSLALGVNAGEMAKKYDLDADALESLAKVIRSAGSEIDGLSDDIKTNSRECIEIAKDISRFDKAVVSITKNYKNWSKALKSGNSQDVADSIVEMQEAYGDLLDLDGSKFSNQFLQSAKNLDLMKAAINGNEEAYNELLDAANQDLEGTIKNSLDPAAATEFGNSLDAVRAMMQAAGFDALQAGDDINAALNSIDDPHMSNDSFLQSLTEMVNAAGMTAEQATNFLSSMGVDAEIETITDEQPATKTVNSLEPTITYKKATNPSIADDGTLSTVDVDVPQITYAANPEQIEDTTVGAGFSLKVTSANKSSGGGTKLKNSSHGSGNGKKGGGGGGRRGGGGGRGREFRKIDRTEKDEKQKKKVEDEIERYHKVKNELQDIEKELSLIGKAKDRAFGRNKIRQIDAETASLKKQSETQKKYLSEIQGWLEKDNAKAKEFGFEINGEGLVTNYEENMKKLIDKVNGDYDNYIAKLNALEDAYNAAGVDDEDSKKKFEDDKKALAKEWEANQKYYEDAKEALSKQEETHDLLIEQQEALQDMLNNIYDNGVTKITYIVELKVDVEDRDIALLQDLLEDIGDKADGACDSIANFGKQVKDTFNKVDTYTQGIRDILEHAGADEDLIDKILNNDFNEDDWEDVLNIGQDENGLNETEIEHLKSTADALLQTNKDLRELREQALQKTSEAFEEFNEQLDRGIAKIEHLTTVTQTYRDVLDIVGKDVLDRNGKLTDALNKQTYNIQRNHTHALQSQLDFIDTALEKARGLYNEAVQNGYNQKTIESLKADVEKYEDERQTTYEEWLDSWREECQIAKDYYEDTLNQILHDFEDAVAGQFKNLSGLSEEFARKNEIADIYVEDYEKIYQLSKLTRDINNSLDDSTTIASKAKLRDIQKEINDLQESGKEVSQYDLDVLQKKYEMALAYEQLQEAQNAKTMVRMQRDNEGNYGYVYTADSSDVEAAEQNYEDKLHEMQVLNAEYIQSLQEQIIQAQQDCADALANLRAEDFASYEEYQDAVEQIRKDYTKRIETLSQQMGNAMDNNRTLYEQDWTEYSKATGYKISADKDYIDKFDETVYSQLTGFTTMEEAQSAFVGSVNAASDQAATNWENWYIRTNTALDDAGLSMQNYSSEVGDRVEELGGEASRAEEDVHNMATEFSTAYSNISDTVGDFLQEYDNYIDTMIQSNQALIASINEVIRAYAELNGEDDDDDDDVKNAEDLEWQEQKDANGVSTGWKVYDKKNKKYLTGKNRIAWSGNDSVQGYTADYDIDDQGNVKQKSENNVLGSGFFGTDFTEEQKAKLRKPQIIKAEINMTDDEKKYGPGGASIKAEIAEAATGMYTGDWGDNSGKLAVLHEKELVLNADDTKNILSAVDMIRSISKTIDLNALAAGSIFASPNSAYKSSFGSKESLEQNVHIQAEFPNVSDHNEIEEALNNLIERAAQFAGRKNL